MLGRWTVAGLWGLYAAAETPPELPLVDKLGLAAITAALIYWMTSRLTRQLDEQTVAIRETTKAVADLGRELRARLYRPDDEKR